MISCYNHIKNPIVVNEVDIYEYIEQIKRPKQSVLEMINKARFYHTDNKSLYDEIKAQLPCFTLNFSFNKRKTNINIKAPTGFIYLDLDDKIDIDLTNELIFVSWKSLSNTGRGILVKANGLTITNFKSTYLSIAKELSIKADKNAIKPTQYCVHSYDKDIYVNNNSITYECKEEVINNTPKTTLYLKRKRKDNTEMGVFDKLKFNNIDDFDFKGKDYLYFKEEKIFTANVFIPKIIKKGGRNNIFSSIAYQIKALNKHIKYDDFYRLMISLNYAHCRPILDDDEVESIIDKVFIKEDLEPISNKGKRFIFNPVKGLKHKEIMKIVNPINGKARVENTLKRIENTLLNWNIKTQGKVTIKSLIAETGMCKNTIEKYYTQFKELRTKINNDLKLLAS